MFAYVNSTSNKILTAVHLTATRIINNKMFSESYIKPLNKVISIFCPVKKKNVCLLFSVKYSDKVQLLTVSKRLWLLLWLWSLFNKKRFHGKKFWCCPPGYQYAVDIGSCNTISYTTFTYHSPYIYSKFTTGASPICPKCRTSTETRIYCLWQCEQIQLFCGVICQYVEK